MKQWWTWFGVVLTLGAIGGFVWSNHSKVSARQLRKGDPTAERLDRLESELRESRASLGLLTAQRIAAASVPSGHAEAPEPSAVSSSERERQTNEPDGTRVDYPEEREVAFFKSYFSELDSAMKGQARDPRLSSQVSQIVQEASIKSGRSEVVDVNCTIQICRVEMRYRHEDRRGRDQFLNDLRDKLTPILDQATIHLPTAEKRMTAYFSKQGSRLPRPAVSFDAFMRGDEG